jgi:mannose-6-phosphate isomerase-like protein (cupin superfamily)
VPPSVLSGMDKTNVADAFASFSEHWRPRIIADVNGSKVQLSKFQGEFVWHKHPESDDFFYVVAGHVDIDFRDGRTIALDEGDLLVIPAGIEHRPRAEREAQIINIALAGTVNTGDAEDPGAFRAPEETLST